MSVFKCKMCGGALEIVANETVATCEYCGTQQTLPKLDDDRRAQMYDRANHFRRNNEYDKAMGVYEHILNEDNTDSEAYWSLVLCRYGIEYVEDPATHKRVPTVNRAQFTSVFDDDNYKSAIKYADTLQKTVYEAEATTINEIQKGILAISQKEEPFDVFICYKETDNSGRRTPDSVLANDLYHLLSQEGFKVFFSRITLEDKLGTAYEPYIFAALNSAKVMVVLGTKPEYFNAVWVKNEWSRYLSLVKQSAGKKMLIPAFKDMEPYDLPDEFSHLQAQDMSKLGFMQDLIRGIKKIISADAPATAVKETVIVNNTAAPTNTNIAPLLERAFMFLEDGDFNSGNEYAEKVLDSDPKCAEAYLVKLMAETGTRRREELCYLTSTIDDNSNYQKILRFGSKELITEIKTYNDLAQKNGDLLVFQKAKALMNKAQTKKEFIEAEELFDSVQYIENAKELSKQCKINSKRISEKYKTIFNKINIYLAQKAELEELIQEANSTYEKNKYEFFGEKAFLKKSAKNQLFSLKHQYENMDNSITFGRYYFDKNIQPMRWLILHKEYNKALLVSYYAIDCKKYGLDDNAKWADSSIRLWLNNEFFNIAFDENEKSIIANANINGYSYGVSNADKIFLLSSDDARKYFYFDSSRKCIPTPYAIKAGAWISSKQFAGNKATCWWWLQDSSSMVSAISSDGEIVNNVAKPTASDGGVRPAMWISLDA